jgi:hypothetical protein
MRRRTKLERAAYIRVVQWEPMRQWTPVQGAGSCRANKIIIQRRSTMKRVTKIAIGAGTALTLGLAAAVVNAHPYGDGPGWGMGQGPGYGPGAGMMGQGPGYGPGPGMGQGMGPMGYGPMGHGPMGRGMGPQVYGDPAAAADWRLSGLKSELKITAAQESAWKAFADQATQQADAMQKLMTSAQGSAKATAPERLEQRNHILMTRLEHL